MDASSLTSTVIPARTERGHVKAHEDRWAQSGTVTASVVGLVYLGGGGGASLLYTEGDGRDDSGAR